MSVHLFVCSFDTRLLWIQGSFWSRLMELVASLWKVVKIRVLLNNDSFQSYRSLLMELLVYLAKTCHAGVELKHCLYMDLWCLQWRYIIYEYSGADNPLLCSNGTAKLISLAYISEYLLQVKINSSLLTSYCPLF